MLSSTALIFSLLFASVVVADIPHASLESLHPGHVEQRTTAPIQNKHWAGALVEISGTFNFVTGVFAVPNPKWDNKKDNHAWFSVIMDGLQDPCATALKATVSVEFIADNEPIYNAWASLSNNSTATYFSDFTVSAGDVVQLNITATTPTTGIAAIENFNTGVQRSVTLSSTTALCRSSAAWVAEDPIGPGYSDHYPFAKFEDFSFTEALATGPHAHYGPLWAEILDIVHDNHILTSVEVNENSVAIHRL